MKPFESINVIPFIDIMLVLLAIVLTTATFITQGKLEIELPEAQSQKPRSDTPKVELAIDQDGRIFFETQPIEMAALGERLAALSSDTPIVLRVDTSARFGYFVSVVDQLKLRKLDRLTILTQAAK